MSNPSPDSASQVTHHDELHAAYNYPNADVTFRSADGILFKVHSVILKLASDVFADMFTLPKASADEPEVVQLDEDSKIICAIFDSIYPRRLLPEISSFAFLSNLAIAADKYDISDITDRIRKIITAPVFAQGTPLEHYALACRLDWKEEARIVSQHIKPLNTEHPKERIILESIDTPSLLKLLSLHRRRSLTLASMRIDVGGWSDTEPYLRMRRLTGLHATCGSKIHNEAIWVAFKMAAWLEIEKMSPAQCERGLRVEFWQGNNLPRVWADGCSKCGSPCFERDYFIKEFERVLSLFPKSINDN